MVDYVDTINGTGIGGYIVDSDWGNWKGLYLISNGTMDGNSSATYELTGLPSDGYGYLVTGWVYYHTGTTNGQIPDVYIYNGKTQFANRILFGRVRSGAYLAGAMSWAIYVPPDNHNIIIKTLSSANIQGLYLYWTRYQRVGTNG